jgi:hypothetical protein
MILPRRKLGRLANGFEASYVALGGEPFRETS